MPWTASVVVSGDWSPAQLGSIEQHRTSDALGLGLNELLPLFRLFDYLDVHTLVT